MSEERPSAAEAMYGRDGPINDGPAGERTRALIEQGIAHPDERYARESPPARQEARGPTFDSARYPGRDQLDPGMTGEFSAVARELGLTQRGGERLLEMHSRAVKASEEAYARRLAEGSDQLARELNPEHVQIARDLIADERMTPKELRPWLETWGNHPLIARLLVNWAAAIRGGRH
jgi:hypothetical protein